MGLKLFSDSCTGNSYEAPNPNPHSFSVIDYEVVGNSTILLARYHGCTTFGGLKLLLLNIQWDNRTVLDPHFLNAEHIVKARFEPTDLGYKLARKCAETIL